MDSDTCMMNFLPDTNYLTFESEKFYKTDRQLYDYINGGAELYLNYGFKKMVKRVYTLSDGNEIKVEIFDMSSPKNAYGVFSYSKQKVNIGIGQGAQYIGGSLIFWQDQYFVSVFAKEETEESRKHVRLVGKKISENIRTTGELPTYFHIIPKQNLIDESTFYFHHHAWQNKYMFISNENIFKIDDHVDALLNQYGESGARYYLLLIHYPNSKISRKCRKKSVKALAPSLAKKKVIQDDDGKWTGSHLTGSLLIWVFDAPTKEKAEFLLDQTIRNYQKDDQ
jgi:hypothetical protein